jgi:glutathione peroxidase
VRLWTCGLAVGAAVAVIAAAPASVNDAYDVTMTAIDGKPMPFAAYQGKVLLVVNTASQCGFTPQYKGLQQLQDRYGSRGFTVIGVPSGDFRNQEFAENSEIKQFCESQFGIRFPMTERSAVTGREAASFYRWAAAELGPQNTPRWNFHKYLVGRDGKLIRAFPSKVEPGSPELTGAIEKALSTKAG